MNSRVLDDAISLIERATLTSAGMVKFPANFAILKYSEEMDVVHHQLLIEHFSKAEAVLRDGSKILVNMFFENKTPEIENRKTFYFKKLSSKEVTRQMKDFRPDLVDLCWSAFSLSGPTGKISVEKSSSNRRGIEVRTGAEFRVISPTGNFSYLDPQIVIIDGFLESPSELETLFFDTSKAKSPVVLVCRGMSEDVLHTITVNLKRGAFNLRPLICKFDENGINTLRDLSLSTGSCVTTSDEGSLISSAKLEGCPHVTRASCIDGSLTVENPLRDTEVRAHVSGLLKKIESSMNDFSSELSRVRAASLSQLRCTIFLEDSVEYPTTRVEVDRILKKISDLFKCGVSDDEDEYAKSILKPIFESCFSALSSQII